MRVEAVDALPKAAENAGPPASDSSTSLAIKNFQSALASEDSLVALLEPFHAAVPADKSGAFFADVLLAFKQPELAAQRSLYFLLLQKLVELLGAAGSQETLEAKLCLLTLSRDSNSPAIALCVRLAARADSPEQAMLRWGLGLAHLQQALLFTSRHLRQHLKQNGT